MLVLEIAWVGGFARLARHPADPEPDWPPEPDRIFSALVASYGAGGEDRDERAALLWLESLDPPEIDAVETTTRDTVTVFVPPNDVATLPAQRRRQPRTFPTVTLDPDAPFHLRLIWREVNPADHLPALKALAERTSHVGHSASFVRCRFVTCVPAAGVGEPRPAQRAPYPGRLQALQELYLRHRQGDVMARSRPSMRSGRAPRSQKQRPCGPFAGQVEDWVVLAHAGGQRPDLRATAVLGEIARNALLESWTDVHGLTPPTWLSGHAPNGGPTCEPHLAVVPLANVGWEYSDGALFGLAFVPPRSIAEQWKDDTAEAFDRRVKWEQALDRLLARAAEPGVVELGPRSGRWRWRLRPNSLERASLDPSRYFGPSKTWASVTPVVLDRHLKDPWPSGVDEAVDQLRSACERAGLPAPDQVVVTKHAGVRGSPPAWPPTGAPPWSAWARRKCFGQRPMVHVQLHFPEPIAGPLLLGAGRFVGLGLFLPLCSSDA